MVLYLPIKIGVVFQIPLDRSVIWVVIEKLLQVENPNFGEALERRSIISKRKQSITVMSTTITVFFADF